MNEHMGQIRYYAKVNAIGETYFFGERVVGGNLNASGHRGSPKVIGLCFRRFCQQHPNAQRVNGPREGWQEGSHSDGFGEYQLRSLSEAEESELLLALEA